MKKRMWVLGLVVAVAGIAGAGTMATAQRFTTNTGKDEVVNSSLYSAGQEVKIRGEINGDVFCAGRDIDIDAVVHGDVICAGQEVTIAGTVDGDVRVAGQRVSISADVYNNVTAAADVFSLDAPSKVGGDVTALGTTLNLKGTISRDALVSGTNGIVNGIVGRDVRFDGTTLQLKDKARINGALTYTSRQDVRKDDAAVVKGETTHNQPKQESAFSFNLGWYLIALSALLLTAMVIALIAPRTLQSMSTHIGTAWIKPMLVGFAASILLPFLAVTFMVTVVGIPLGAMVLLGWLLLMVLSGPVVGYYVGQRILRKQKNVLVRMLVGTAIVVTAYFIPFLGFLVLLAAYWTGSGAILLAAKRRLGKPNYEAK